MNFVKYSAVIFFQKFKKRISILTNNKFPPNYTKTNRKIFSIINIYYNIVKVTMTYNLCYFLGNKAFVIDFLVTGFLCCVCLRPYYPSSSVVSLLSVNKTLFPETLFQGLFSVQKFRTSFPKTFSKNLFAMAGCLPPCSLEK